VTAADRYPAVVAHSGDAIEWITAIVVVIFVVIVIVVAGWFWRSCQTGALMNATAITIAKMTSAAQIRNNAARFTGKIPKKALFC